MDRLITLEPSNLVPVRIEQGHKCYGEVTLRNVMYTMPVAFKLHPLHKNRYTIRPQSGIIAPLATVTVEITYHHNASLPDSFPHCNDAFQLHSVVAPGAAMKDQLFDSVPNEWFTNKKKQVFIDSGIRILFVGSLVLAKLVANGSMDDIREVLEKTNPSWNPVDSVDRDGQTLLHLAIAQGRADLVQLLLEFEPDVEARSRAGSSPLEAAASAGEALIVELLLANKASTQRSESSAWGPVHLAAGGGHAAVLRLLLLKGANPDSLTRDGNTALHLAVLERRRDCVRLLLASGAMVDIRNTSDGDTPLHIAAGIGDEQMVKLLLQKGANKDVRNLHRKTAYDAAAENGFTRLFDTLLLGDKLCIAARKGEVRAINRLIENGAAINGRDQHGWTALHRAAFKGKIDVIRTLIEKGVEIDGRDEEGYTALHCAVEAGNVEAIELLVKKGADVEGRTNKGVSPMQIAESLNYLGITRILANGGATKDGAKQGVSVPVMVPFGYGLKSREKEIGEVKKKPIRRARGSRGSFDRSVPLAVL